MQIFNDSKTVTYAMDERDFTIFESQMSFGMVSYFVQSPDAVKEELATYFQR